MKKPNFFIIGAPKCGTTSLAGWLGDLDNVYMSNPKELEFFDFDRKKGWKDDYSRYWKFFEKASVEHVAVGEASTAYLRSRVAVVEILKHIPDAKFVVGIRNPVELAFSWHGQVIFEGWENVSDFEEAWSLQNKRRSGLRVPKFCPDPNDLLYGDVCSLGTQVSRLFEVVPRERVFVYTLDRMRSDSPGLWADLLEFLEIPFAERSEFSVRNAAKEVPAVFRLATRFMADYKRRLGVTRGFGILRKMTEFSSKKRNRVIAPCMKLELNRYFKNEIALLAKSTGLDLRDWDSSVEVFEK